MYGRVRSSGNAELEDTRHQFVSRQDIVRHEAPALCVRRADACDPLLMMWLGTTIPDEGGNRYLEKPRVGWACEL